MKRRVVSWVYTCAGRGEGSACDVANALGMSWYGKRLEFGGRNTLGSRVVGERHDVPYWHSLVGDDPGGLRRAVVALRSQAGLEVINKHNDRQRLLSYGIETRAQPKEH